MHELTPSCESVAVSAPVLDRRRAGILLHPTSLPGSPGNGDLGPEAYRFVDFAAACGFTVWQVLPLGPTDEQLSPYSCCSIHAGNTQLISLDALVERGWLAPDNEGSGTVDPVSYRRARLKEAYAGFLASATAEERKAYKTFLIEHGYWLENHVLFQALKEAYNGIAWWEWPEELRDRDLPALREARIRLARSIEQHRFEQFLFFRQWLRLKDYAHERGILLFGDMPVFVSVDSAAVWARREFFRLDAQGRPEVVAGVPPDYFSATGQRWGNPHYDWERMQQDDFRWWRDRVTTQMELFDLVRVDHFRGFEAFWEIGGDAETAMHGHWVKVPGAELFDSLRQVFRPLPLVAEDLGIITPEVNALRDRFGFPGMKVLQFAFDGGPDNPYLPHNHVTNCVAYLGTHDNNTTLGWYREMSPEGRAYLCEYLGVPTAHMPWDLIRTALASVARLAVLTMQDILALGSQHRMNLPGVAEGNWRWRFTWDQVPPQTADRVHRLIELYGRAVP